MSDMNATYATAMQTLIRLAAAGARKEDMSGVSVDWDHVFPLAAEQHIIPLVACALLDAPELEHPDQLREQMIEVMRAASAENLIRQQRIMNLLQEMKMAGIDAMVIKGYAVSGCYAHPECRGATDTDLLINIEQEKAAIEFLENKDFQISIRGETSHHSVCQHKKYGVIELHVSLYAELVRDVWFADVTENELVQEKNIMVSDENGTYMTLGYTDHLIFLTLHMMKHFILEGLTLRMMLDLALFFSKNKDFMDVRRYWSVMKKLHYEQLVNSVLWSMILYGGFAQTDFPGIMPHTSEQVSAILTDLLQGGYLGIKEKEARYKSGMQYNRQMLLRENSRWRYMLFMIRWKLRSGLNALFPSVYELCRRYPGAEGYRLLIPVIWICHAFSFLRKNWYKMVPGRDIQWKSASSNDVVQQRMELFEKLGMLNGK